MVRLEKYAEEERQHLLNLPCPRYATTPFVTGIRLADSRVAVVSTAGLHRRSDLPFAIGDTGYRSIPVDIDPRELVMSHVSTNFDRTGFQLDMNMVLPFDRLRELAADGVIGSVADCHYSFMGATDPAGMAGHAAQLAALLQRDNVDALLLVPV